MRLRVLAGVVFACVLVAALAGGSFPYLPRPLELTIVFPAEPDQPAEPLLSTGVHGRADFLNLHYRGNHTAVLEYAAWGPDGPVSEPFRYEPGKRYSLTLDLPSLDYGGPWLKRETRPMRVTLDGRDVLNSPVIFYPRKPEEVYFGLNPIGGGKTDGCVFSGRLMTRDGSRLLGGPESYFSFAQRLATWVARHPGQVPLVLLASVAFGFGFVPAWRWGRRWVETTRLGALAGHARPPHRAFAATGIGCALVFSALITQGTFDFAHEESFGSFYDHQARSLLEGRLDVPREIIGGEAFIVEGKSYGYHGIAPALLRLPFAATGLATGRLSRLYMLGYYGATLLAGYLLLCHAARLLARNRRDSEKVAPGFSPRREDRESARRGLKPGATFDEPDSGDLRGCWPSRLATVLFTLAVGLGSTLFFLGSRAYLYHEAILCGAVAALWAVYCAFRYLDAPASRWCWGALVCGLLAVHARPPAGLFALGVFGVASLWQVAAAWRERKPAAALRHAALGGLATLAFGSLNGVSYLKFGTFDASPFQYAVQYTPERLARFEGRKFHLANIPRNLDTYVLQPDFALHAKFPFVFLEGGEERTYPAARIDYSEPTLALPYAMPALFALATLGAAWAAWRAPALRRNLAVLLLGLAPMAVALFSAIVTSHRYTGDFVPFLAAAAAIGLAVLDAERQRLRRLFLSLLAVLTTAAIAVNLAIAVHFQGEVIWGVPEETKRNYETLRRSVDAFFGLE